MSVNVNLLSFTILLTLCSECKYKNEEKQQYYIAIALTYNLKYRYNEPRYNEFHDIVNETQLPFSKFYYVTKKDFHICKMCRLL